jgi:D-alanyl-lipoteichoic acid acyltransferase DltB (MBOAT superfamily)
LYIPLGGNKKGKLRMNFNLMITMLLGGLWHGANLRFLIWGGIHGIALVIQKVIENMISINSSKNKFFRLLSIFITFHIVTFAWLFFRAKNMASTSNMLHQIFTNFNAKFIPEILTGYYKVLGIVLIGFTIHWLPSRIKETYRGWFIRTNYFVKAIIIIVTAFLLYQINSADLQPFIYFQF